MGNALSQSVWIPTPTITEKTLTDQKGRVHVVTGGYAGVGYQLTKILYQHNATIFIAGRSKEKGDKAIASIKQELPNSSGKLEYLHLDLADLPTIKASAEDLMSRTDRIDVLTNNAGVMMPPYGSKTPLGHELQIGTNVLGPFLFTTLLLPLLKKTASSSPKGSVRVTWAASLATNFAPPRGLSINDNGDLSQPWDVNLAYAVSKAANAHLAVELARRYGKGSGDIVSAAWNPGNLKSELQRHLNFVSSAVVSTICYPANFGAYTELFAAVSPELSLENNGKYVIPWGRVGSVRPDIERAGKSEKDGGTGEAEKLWLWCEKETKQYA